MMFMAQKISRKVAQMKSENFEKSAQMQCACNGFVSGEVFCINLWTQYMLFTDLDFVCSNITFRAVLIHDKHAQYILERDTKL